MADIGSRLAGKALLDFAKASLGSVGSAAEQQTLKYLQRKAGEKGLIGLAASHPEVTAKLVGAAAPAATIGGVVAANELRKALFQDPETVYASSEYSLPVQTTATGQKQPIFPHQQYTPGASPFTNEQAGQALLAQQKFEHDLQLIKARQSASSPQNPYAYSYGDGTIDLNTALQKTYTYQ